MHKSSCTQKYLWCSSGCMHWKWLTFKVLGSPITSENCLFLCAVKIFKFCCQISSWRKHSLCVVCWLPEVLHHLMKAVTLQPTFPHHCSPSGTSDNYLAAFSEYNLSESTYRWDSVVYALLWLLPFPLLEMTGFHFPLLRQIYDFVFISYLSCCCDKSKISQCLSLPGYGPSWQGSLNVMSSRQLMTFYLQSRNIDRWMLVFS